MLALALALAVLAPVAGVLLGLKLGDDAARRLWAPTFEAADDLARELALRRLRGED